MSVQPLNIKQLRIRFDKEKPKFICLRNDEGSTEIPWNNINTKPAVRMKEIEDFFKKDSTPDGLYYFVQRESFTGNTKERQTPVAKGDVTKVATREKPAPIIMHEKAEEVWDFSTALDKSTQIITLTLQLRIATQELQQARRTIAELEAELDGLGEGGEEPGGSSKTMDGIKQLIDTVQPVVDKHFELREKELNQRERYLTQNSGRRGTRITRESPADGSREDGGVPVTDPGYEKYFADVHQNGSQDQFEYECDYLEQTSPELWEQFRVKYEIEDEPEENTEP